MKPSNNNPNYRWISIIIINFLILTFGIVFLELSFGDWLGKNTSGKVPNIIRNFSGEFDVSEFYGYSKKVRYTRDKHGLRGNYDSPSKIDFLTIGGSTTDQRGLSDDSTWQSLLSYKLKCDGLNSRWANAGIDGQSTYGHIQNFDWWFSTIPNIKSRYILVYAGVNDFYLDGTNYSKILRNEGIIEKLKAKSAIYKLYKNLVNIYKVEFMYDLLGHKPVDFQNKKWTDTPMQQNHQALLNNRSDALRERLLALIKKINDFGSQPIFVTQMFATYSLKNNQILGLNEIYDYDGTMINGIDVYYMMDIFNDIFMDVCQNNGGICIDLGRELNLEANDFYDYVHPNEVGTEKIVDFLYERLVKFWECN